MNKCIALTIRNQRCKFNTQKNDTLCTRHIRLRDNGGDIKYIERDILNHNHIIDHEENVINHGENNIYHNVVHEENYNHNHNQNQITNDGKDNNDNLIECVCCFDTYEVNEIITCTRTREENEHKHTMCHGCAKMFIENTINDRKKIKCILNKECDGEYDDSDLQNILDKKLYQRYKEYMQVDLATRLAPILDNYHLCPFCSKYGIIIENMPGYNNHHVKTIECMNEECRTTWCVTCRKAYHGNDPCNKIYTDSNDVLNKTINETIDSAMIHNCPKCYTKYNKEDGCNLMTCPSCDAHSCYLCGILVNPINGLKYWHFKGSGSANSNSSCPLYNVTDPASKYTSNDVTKANIEFNNKKVIDALNNLIEINKDNQAIVTGIKKNLVSRGYRQFEEKKIHDVVTRFRKYPKVNKYPKIKIPPI